MLGQPKYERYDIVKFYFGKEEKEGYIYIVDAYGTFEQDEEPSYDIMVDGGDESGLYKHCRESRIIEKTGRYNKKWVNRNGPKNLKVLILDILVDLKKRGNTYVYDSYENLY